MINTQVGVKFPLKILNQSLNNIVAHYLLYKYYHEDGTFKVKKLIVLI